MTGIGGHNAPECLAELNGIRSATVVIEKIGSEEEKQAFEKMCDQTQWRYSKSKPNLDH